MCEKHIIVIFFLLPKKYFYFKVKYNRLHSFFKKNQKFILFLLSGSQPFMESCNYSLRLKFQVIRHNNLI